MFYLIFYHYLYQDLWIPTWPNLLAATIPTVTVVKLIQIAKRHHAEHMRHLRRLKPMPYKVEKDGENYKVINEETGEVKATHEPPDAEEKANRQVRLLNEIEHDPNWEPSDG